MCVWKKERERETPRLFALRPKVSPGSVSLLCAPSSSLVPDHLLRFEFSRTLVFSGQLPSSGQLLLEPISSYCTLLFLHSLTFIHSCSIVFIFSLVGFWTQAMNFGRRLQQHGVPVLRSWVCGCSPHKSNLIPEYLMLAKSYSLFGSKSGFLHTCVKSLRWWWWWWYWSLCIAFNSSSSQAVFTLASV